MSNKIKKVNKKKKKVSKFKEFWSKWKPVDFILCLACILLLGTMVYVYRIEANAQFDKYTIKDIEVYIPTQTDYKLSSGTSYFSILRGKEEVADLILIDIKTYNIYYDEYSASNNRDEINGVKIYEVSDGTARLLYDVGGVAIYCRGNSYNDLEDIAENLIFKLK